MMSQDANGDSSSTTRSAISAGTINITNQAAQTQDVSTLSRDTTNTNGTVSQTPDVNTLLSQQAETMQAAQAAGQVVAQGIGMYADSKQATDASWAEGGNSRALAQAVGGALIGGLGGGSAFTTLGGAAGAGLTSKAAQGLNDIAAGVESETGSALLGNLAGNIVAGLGGALVGGTAGAATASSVQLYNQERDPLMQRKSLVPSACSALGPCNVTAAMAQVNATAANSQAAAAVLAPNYATLGGSVLSGSAGAVVNLQNGNIYGSAGVSQIFAAPSWIPGGTATLGWIFGGNGASATDNFINGDGNQLLISLPTPLPFNVVAAVTHAYGGPTAIELGVSTPGDPSVSVTPWSHSTPIISNSK
jgi:filamentous hemagglutinin